MELFTRLFQRMWVQIISGLLGGAIVLAGSSFSAGREVESFENRLRAVEVRQVQIEGRQDKLDQQIYERLGKMEHTLTRIDAEQCVYHRGVGCEERRGR